MSEFKKKLRHEIVDPARESSRVTTITGTVIETDKNGRCAVEFIDKTGTMHKNEVLKIRVYGNNKWMPEVGQSVLIEENDYTYEITGRYIDDWTKYKEENTLKADVYSNLIIDNVPGSLF